MGRKIFLVFLAVPALLCAQGARRGGFAGGIGMQWWDNPVASGLNLTPEQNTQIRSIVREFRTKLIDLRAAEEKAQGDLQDVFNDAPTDQRRATDAIDRLGNARGEMTKTISQMSLRMRNVLTPEQWQELRQRQENFRNSIARPPFDSKEDSKSGQPGIRLRRRDRPNVPGGPPGVPPPPKPAQQQ